LGYRIADPELRERVEWQSRQPLIDSVRKDIHLLKGLIEERINLDDSPAGKMNTFNRVTPTLLKLVGAVETLTKLEERTSVVLGRAAIEWLGDRIIAILTEAFDGMEDRRPIVEKVAREIAQAIAEARNQD
jgi:hypothetical protein